MTKKKFAIYGLILSVFIVLLSVYIWTVLQSANKINSQHLYDNIRLSEAQIKKNIEYHIRFLMFELSKFEINKSSPFQEVVNLADTVEAQSGGGRLYIADKDGIMYKNKGKLNGRKLDAAAMKMAKTTGYAAISVLLDAQSGKQSVALIIPFPGALPYYFVQINSAEDFIKMIAQNIAVPTSNLVLFDEWGNQISVYSQGDSAVDIEASKSLAAGANEYKSNMAENDLQKKGFSQHYNAYVKLEQPRSWFLGSLVDYSHFNPISSGIVSSSAVIFALLILIFVVIIILDIVNDIEKKKELFLVNNVDQLTGLVNNTGIQEVVTLYMQKNSVVDYSFVCIDIVAFSRVNAMFGYSVGDMLLRIVSGVIRDRYFCGARTNADCFCFFAPTSENMAAIMEVNFFNAIESQMGKKYLQMIAFKFGIYPIQDHKVIFRDMLDGATLALRDAKKHVKQTEVIFDTHLKKSVELQKKIEMNMMHALSKDEFVVYIQPQFNMPEATCMRGEALIRWNSEFMGFMPPDKFISIFENNGFIVETDFFMLTSVLQILQDRYDAGLDMVTIAVNQSKVTIAFPNYFERIKSIVEQFTVPLKYVELEITESTLENELDQIVPLTHNLKKMGFMISMDDFGSGFSSLNTLRILPIDILKIDKGFLQESDTSERSKKIIRSIINMAKELSITVICEGVERIDQLDFLKAAGCDIVQGYYFSKPIPMTEFITQYLEPLDGAHNKEKSKPTVTEPEPIGK